MQVLKPEKIIEKITNLETGEEYKDDSEWKAKGIPESDIRKDVRVIIVKLCDRLHNMRTIEFLPREKQIRKSIETLELYGPIAIRVGMQDIRVELEDLAFKCLHPMRARMLESAIAKAVGGRKRIVSKLRKQFKYYLKNNDILATVQGRQKSLYSIYSKIKFFGNFHQHLFNAIAFHNFAVINSCTKCFLVILDSCF